MKAFKFLLLFTLTTFFIACDNDNEPIEEPIEEIEGRYMGKVTIDPNGEDFYEKETAISIEELTESTIKLIIHDAKFAERMPAMTIAISGITAEKTSSELILSGDGIIPTVAASGLEVTMYTITNLEGKIKDNKLSFTMMCGRYPFEYTGKMEE